MLRQRMHSSAFVSLSVFVLVRGKTMKIVLLYRGESTGMRSVAGILGALSREVELEAVNGRHEVWMFR
jgi:hypothetical protein